MQKKEIGKIQELLAVQVSWRTTSEANLPAIDSCDSSPTLRLELGEAAGGVLERLGQVVPRVGPLASQLALCLARVPSLSLNQGT